MNRRPMLSSLGMEMPPQGVTPYASSLVGLGGSAQFGDVGDYNRFIVPPEDMSDLYNTQLTPDQETAFLAWQKSNPRLGGTYDYDARGFWRDGAMASDNGHGGDRWKKPNHPTFSTGSQYSGKDGYVGGAWGKDGGAWTFTPSRTNTANMSMSGLKRYFSSVEPGNVLFSPWEK